VPLQLPDGGAVVVDALWRRKRLVVETDGRLTHSMPAAFERDRHRDAQLALAGFTVVRFTWRQVTQKPGQAAVTLRRLLA
jgi:very-short-patch-repair endonuclease